ncbi:MAG: hypothetical protein COS84_02445 [Armatimonadetes bacterium CG07_land_8_20_14_0_80_40_9]|nr:MAG: hypothetical protein COS84_02445 [Armatimonadetes bacterium CG07_land_8_20_14_0_80_40_9]
MYRPESLIIDNDKLRLFDELNSILKEQKSLDVASAYFNIAGFQLIKDSLSGAEKFRLLLGTSPQIDEKKPDIFQPEELYQKKFREDLEEEVFERDKKEAVVSLIELAKTSKGCPLLLTISICSCVKGIALMKTSYSLLFQFLLHFLVY